MQPERSVEMWGTGIRRTMVVVLAVVLVGAASALAATRLRPGSLYTGKTCTQSGGAPDTTCVLRFRASQDGESMQFVGSKAAVDTWGCHGLRIGGGEAFLGGRKGDPIPVVKVRANGTLSGSVSYTFRPTSAPPEHFTDTVTGQVANDGRRVTVTFHNIYLSGHGNELCATAPVTLTQQ
jgi:hypothetical protein